MFPNRPPLHTHIYIHPHPQAEPKPLLLFFVLFVARVGAPSASWVWSLSLKLCSLPLSIFCVKPCNVYFLCSQFFCVTGPSGNTLTDRLSGSLLETVNKLAIDVWFLAEKSKCSAHFFPQMTETSRRG